MLVKLRVALHRFLIWDFLGYTQPNYSFKPKPLRYSKKLAKKACQLFPSATRFGLTQVLDVMSKFNWLLPVVLAATALACPLFAADQPVEFTPQNGFGGVSEGRGTLTLFLGKPRAFHVSSRGTPQSDGTFRLDQIVTFEGQAPQDRFWILTITSNNCYSATLSDAAGPVKGVTSGSHLSLESRVKGPLVMHQELELSPDGKTIDNVGVITLIGIPVGRLHETITR